MTRLSTPAPPAPLTPAAALERVLHLLDRQHASVKSIAPFATALETVLATDAVELAEWARDQQLVAQGGIDATTAQCITEALAGLTPQLLTTLEHRTQVPITKPGRVYLEALRGDCHMHSTWSDGGAEIRAMVATAVALGHQYAVLTDHSARLTIAHGLNEQRLSKQLDELAAINAELQRDGIDFRLLAGMEVDILSDGSLDLSNEMLARLDVVVASVHSNLRMESAAMTRRLVAAVANPHVDILGHCTGRKIGKRPPSKFDPDFVFAACAKFGTAVEINCRPERLDPPRHLLKIAIEHGCYFSIDTDAHATGQLEWQPRGCDRAAKTGVPIDRIINTWAVSDLLAWTQPAP